MQRTQLGFTLLAVSTAVVFAFSIGFIFLHTPAAQMAAGGLAQKIFYFHVPAAYAMYLSGLVCCIASAAYLLSESETRNALAQAAAECAVVFGCLVMVSGPLWAKKAWGVYWTWEPRLTISLLTLLVYVAVVLLRGFAGSGEAEKRFAAALGVLGTFTLPFIHFAVSWWGGNHPTVIGGGGGGLAHPAMRQALYLGFFAMTLLAAVLIWSRTRLLGLSARVERLEHRAATAGVYEGG